MAKNEHTAHFGNFEDPLDDLLGFSQKDRANTTEIDMRTTMASDSSILQKRVKIETITESGQDPDFGATEEDLNFNESMKRLTIEKRKEDQPNLKRKKTKNNREIKEAYEKAANDDTYMRQKSYLYDDLHEKDDLDSEESDDDSGSDTFGLDRDDTQYERKLTKMGLSSENAAFGDDREDVHVPQELTAKLSIGHLESTGDFSSSQVGPGSGSSSDSGALHRAVTTGHVKERTGEFGLGQSGSQFEVEEEDDEDDFTNEELADQEDSRNSEQRDEVEGFQRFDSGLSGIGVDRMNSAMSYGYNFDTQMSGLTIGSNDVLQLDETVEGLDRSNTIEEFGKDPSVEADMMNMSRKLAEEEYEDRSDIDSLDSDSSDDSISRSNTVFDTNGNNFLSKPVVSESPTNLLNTAQITEIKNRYSAVNQRRNCRFISREDTNKTLEHDDPSLSKVDALRAKLQGALTIPVFTQAYHIVKHLTLEDPNCSHSTFEEELKGILEGEVFEKYLPYLQTLIYLEEMSQEWGSLRTPISEYLLRFCDIVFSEEMRGNREKRGDDGREVLEDRRREFKLH